MPGLGIEDVPGSGIEDQPGPQIGPPRPRGRTPDFFIVGHQKSGTTALYQMLRGHPQIFMPELKEPRFFARPDWVDAAAAGLPETLEDYLALFAPARPGQLVGEASPSYLRAPEAAGQIAKLQPHARIIAILREPASLIRSLHLQLLQEHFETERDLRRAFAREKISRGGTLVRRYSDHIHYVAQLQRFHALFGRERVLVLVYEDFRADNVVTVRRVLRFLEVDDAAPLQALEANPTVRVRMRRVDRLTRTLQAGRGPAARAAKRAAMAVLPRRLAGRAFWAMRRRVIYGEPDPPDEELMGELRARFAGEVVAVSEYLERDLVSEWGYGGLG